MAIIEQLEFFPRQQEDVNRDRIEDVFLRMEKLRKGMFARHGELAKRYIGHEDRISVLETTMCVASRHYEERLAKMEKEIKELREMLNK